MTSKDRPRIEQLYRAALELAPPQRAAFLTEACGRDETLRREVESLLGYEGDTTDFTEAPAPEMVAMGSAADPGMPFVGQHIAHYRILNKIGAGGMGEVYRARDPKLNRDVAIKILPEGLAMDPVALARFEREAQAVAALSHPNILAIHDFGVEGGTRYAVMELLEGETLRARLDHGALPARKATEFATQIAEGLAAAHEKGIVHRV